MSAFDNMDQDTLERASIQAQNNIRKHTSAVGDLRRAAESLDVKITDSIRRRARMANDAPGRDEALAEENKLRKQHSAIVAKMREHKENIGKLHRAVRDIEVALRGNKSTKADGRGLDYYLGAIRVADRAAAHHANRLRKLDTAIRYHRHEIANATSDAERQRHKNMLRTELQDFHVTQKLYKRAVANREDAKRAYADFKANQGR